MSVSELLPCPPASAQDQGLELSALLDSILLAAEQKKAWEAHYKALLGVLTTHRELGRVEDSFNHGGWSLRWSPGKTTYEWPANIIKMEAALLEAKEAAVVAKKAVQKPSTPFWTATPPKPATAAQRAQ
jgi:hypothetical protein